MHRREVISGAAALCLLHSTRLTAEERPLETELKDGTLWVRHQGRDIFGYRSEAVSGPPGTPALMKRSGYIHPLYSPSGALLTDDFPPDHLHQRGVFFAWTKTLLSLPEMDLAPDFWNLGAGTGRIRSTKAAQTGREFGHSWELRQADAWHEVLQETWRVSVTPAGAEDRLKPGAAHLVDLTSIQRPRTHIELPQYRYGGMCVRGARAWIPKGSGYKVLTSAGRGVPEAEGTRAKWVDMSGPVEGKPGETAGVTLMEHPSNEGAPNTVRVPPENPYVIYCPSKSGSVRLQAGKDHIFRYRLVAHNGGPDVAALEELWKQFAARTD